MNSTQAKYLTLLLAVLGLVIMSFGLQPWVHAVPGVNPIQVAAGFLLIGASTLVGLKLTSVKQ